MPPILPRGVTVYVNCDGGANHGGGGGNASGGPCGADSRRITCFRCGETGHYRGECRSYKVHMCSRFEMGKCAAGSQCTFAHSVGELRKPWMPKCVRVVKTTGWVDVLGCGEYGHTFRNCPNNHQPPQRRPVCRPVASETPADASPADVVPADQSVEKSCETTTSNFIE